MGVNLGDSLKQDEIILSNLVDRIEETSTHYKLSGAITLREYQTLKKGLGLLHLEAAKHAGKGK